MKCIMNDIYEEPLFNIVMEIRKFPGVWLMAASLRALEQFINGYIVGKYDRGFCPKWFTEFQQYVVDICVNGNGCYGIANAIFECGYDDKSGLKYFYQLLDDFLKERQIEEYKKIKPLEEKEVRILSIGKKAILEIVDNYIGEHRDEIFDLPAENSLISNRQLYATYFDEKECYAWAVGPMGYGENFLEKVFLNVPMVESLFQKHPYHVIDMDEIKNYEDV